MTQSINQQQLTQIQHSANQLNSQIHQNNTIQQHNLQLQGSMSQSPILQTTIPNHIPTPPAFAQAPSNILFAENLAATKTTIPPFPVQKTTSIANHHSPPRPAVSVPDPRKRYSPSASAPTSPKATAPKITAPVITASTSKTIPAPAKPAPYLDLAKTIGHEPAQLILALENPALSLERKMNVLSKVTCLLINF
jgi:hypothetical protein